MGSALIASEKSSPLREKLRSKTSLTCSNTISIPKQEQHTAQNIYSTISPNEFDSDRDSFTDEDEEETQWSFERRTATLRDTKKATEEFLAACTDLKKSVSTKVDDLLKHLPNAHDPKFETKYKRIQRQLRKLLPKKQQTNKNN